MSELTVAETAEGRRLAEDARRERNWKWWGPYLAERQWGTVREDYSADKSNWTSFPYEHSLARAYRWGEDGLARRTPRLPPSAIITLRPERAWNHASESRGSLLCRNPGLGVARATRVWT